MWRDAILANISAMLPCTGAATSNSYRGAKILGKKCGALDKPKLWTCCSQPNKKAEVSTRCLLVFYCSMHLSCFFPPLKEVMQKCTSIHDSDPGQHPQTKQLQSLLWTAIKKVKFPLWKVLLTSVSTGWNRPNPAPFPGVITEELKAHRELLSGCLVWKFIFYCLVIGGQAVNSTSQVFQCRIFLFLAHHIQLAFYFMNYLYR